MKNLSFVKVVLASAIIGCGLIATSQEQNKAGAQDQELKKIKEMGIGIYKIKYDSNGAIESFLVVGQAERPPAELPGNVYSVHNMFH